MVSNHITLSFIYFELLESENCNTDYLEIRRHNSSGKLLGVYCGKNKPINITHEGSMWLMYKGSKLDTSDTTITAKGFYGEYSLSK
ncbi:hypothetical protein NQ314_016758 [Rhamnusium bicolor]|uniref:CUB domain-containing protein n=1 Tax=Rhamnusium bicolor TaxID=1586634 RepID=A0AAV8WW86_9CUCU|nr:hypothetical protein NQ314_016758 [Rhamnusium bicolor]